MTDARNKPPKKKGDGRNHQASEKTWEEMTPAKKAKAEATSDEPKPPPPPGAVDMWFSLSNKEWWASNSQGQFQPYSDYTAKLMLKRKGYSDKSYLHNGLTYLEEEYLRLAYTNSVSFAGPLGGFRQGLMEYNGNRILVSNSPNILPARKGDWSTLKYLITNLLDEEEVHFYGWIKSARESLLAGLPWRPGQMLVIAGPENCGKSVLQSLITHMLGGRASSPYKYMEGSTDFNSEIFSAEHGLIGDSNHKLGKGARRAFGAAIKELTVNPEQWVHGKHKGGCTLSAFLRLSLSVNDAPYALQVLPEMESDVRNKLIVLQAHHVPMPIGTDEFPTMHSFAARLRAEIPAFLYAMQQMEIPEEMRDLRYGYRSYHSKSVLEKMSSLSEEWKFWTLCEMYLFAGEHRMDWQGTAHELERKLREDVKGENLSHLFYYSGACGQYLTSLAGKMPDRISVEDDGHNRNRYTIKNSLPPL